MRACFRPESNYSAFIAGGRSDSASVYARVEKSGINGTTVYVYDAFGHLAAEYAAPAHPAPCTTCYLSYDHLGSVRLVTDQNHQVIARHDFLPFGEELTSGQAGRTSQFGATDGVSQRFTGQERDQETGLDFFHARYYGAAFGHFTSPDRENGGADLTNPQSWTTTAMLPITS